MYCNQVSTLIEWGFFNEKVKVHRYQNESRTHKRHGSI